MEEPYKDIKQPVRVVRKDNHPIKDRCIRTTSVPNSNHPVQTLPDGRTRPSSTGGSKRRRYASTKGFSLKTHKNRMQH